MANSKQHRYANSFKHEVCQYYEHHTRNDTEAKYDVAGKTISKWRRELGYRNKFFNRNMYTEGMQPALKKRQQRDFMVTKKDNAFLLNEINDLKSRMKAKDLDSAWLKDKLHQIADAIKTQEI
jgi:hypothetical protein